MNGEPENKGARFVIDGARGSLIVQAFAEGLLSFAGHNPTFAVRQFGGEIRLGAISKEIDSMLVVVRSESLFLRDKVSEKDRAEIESTTREAVLETAKYPEIFFVSKNVSIRPAAGGKFMVTANGRLSLHGEMLPQTIEAEAEISSGAIRATGELSLRQSDFKIEQVKALGGTLKVKDEVKLSFDITAKI